MAICIDCGNKTKSRRKKVQRCGACNRILRHKNAHGRSLPLCKKCGKKVSAIKNSTGLCRKCYIESDIIKDIGRKNAGIGRAPWNKNKSSFKSKSEYRIHFNKKRKISRMYESADKKIADRVRTLIRNQIKMYRKRGKDTKTELILGCNLNYFRDYIESLFSEGMNWSNYGNGHGRWNIDHIKPVSKFNLNDRSELLSAFNYKNCRPMWAIDNIKKGNH